MNRGNVLLVEKLEMLLLVEANSGLVNCARNGLEETLYFSNVEGDLGHLCMGAASSLDVSGYYIKELLFVSLLLPV